MWFTGYRTVNDTCGFTAQSKTFIELVSLLDLHDCSPQNAACSRHRFFYQAAVVRPATSAEGHVDAHRPPCLRGWSE